MSTKQVEAIRNLAQMEEEDGEYKFQPYSSAAFTQKQKVLRPKKRPQTVNTNRNRINTLGLSSRKQNKRQELKRHLRILEDTNYEETPKVAKKIITSHSLYCIAPLANRYNGFPAHPVKKQQGDKYMSPKNINTKENVTPYYCINPEEQIRFDIMKKFKLRESVRENQKLVKINNFLKMAASPSIRNAPAPILFNLNDTKYKRTLTNLLA